MMISTHKTRQGISEIIAVSILLLISLVSSVIIFNFANTSFNKMTDDYKDQIDDAKTNIEGRILVSTIYRNITNNNLTIYIYNYGAIDIIVDKIYVDGKNLEYNPHELTIPSGEILNVELPPSAPDTGHLTIITKTNNRYEVYYET